MLQPSPPLRYQISNWYELVDCLSNTSSKLRISVSDIKDEEYLTGQLIQIIHKKYGVVFSYTINAIGSVVDTEHYVDLSISTLLSELARWGFNVYYNPTNKLSSKVLDYLMTVKKMGFDKIRRLSVKSGTDVITGNYTYDNYIVIFYASKIPEWLNNQYIASEKELSNALVSGYAINLSKIYSETNNINWAWLNDFVANIDDVLAQNAGVPNG